MPASNLVLQLQNDDRCGRRRRRRSSSSSSSSRKNIMYLFTSVCFSSYRANGLINHCVVSTRVRGDAEVWSTMRDSTVKSTPSCARRTSRLCNTLLMVATWQTVQGGRADSATRCWWWRRDRRRWQRCVFRVERRFSIHVSQNLCHHIGSQGCRYTLKNLQSFWGSISSALSVV